MAVDKSLDELLKITEDDYRNRLFNLLDENETKNYTKFATEVNKIFKEGRKEFQEYQHALQRYRRQYKDDKVMSEAIQKKINEIGVILSKIYQGQDLRKKDADEIRRIWATRKKDLEREPEKEPEKELEKESEKKRKLGFVGILNKIEANKNALKDSDIRHIKASQASMLPAKINDDWLHKTMRVAASVCTFPGRLIGKGISKVFATKSKREKLEALIKNVDELPQEEFEILKNGLETGNGQVYKVPASVREAVIQRTARETREKVEQIDSETRAYNKTIVDNMEVVKELDNKIKNTLLSEDKRKEIEAKREELLAITIADIAQVKLNREEAARMQGGTGLHGLEEEDKAAREGANLAGRKFAIRGSGEKDSELMAKIGELESDEIEAHELGDKYKEAISYIERENLLKENTITKKIMGIEMSRGPVAHTDGVVHKDYMEDDLLRNLTTVVFVGAQAISFAKQIEIQRQLKEYNQQIDALDARNQAYADAHNQGIDELHSVAEQTAPKLDKAQRQEEVLANFASSTGEHEAAGLWSKWKQYWGETLRDKAFHNKQKNGEYTPIDEVVLDTLEGAKNNSGFNRDGLIMAADQFVKNGGEQIITNGFDAGRHLVSTSMKLGHVAFDKMNNIKISPDMMPFLIATFGKYANAARARAGLVQAKRNNQSEKENENKELTTSLKKEDKGMEIE